MQKILREPVGNDQNNIKQWTEAILSEMNAISDEAGMEVDWMGPKHRISALWAISRKKTEDIPYKTGDIPYVTGDIPYVTGV